jgi:hypothetical protein
MEWIAAQRRRLAAWAARSCATGCIALPSKAGPDRKIDVELLRKLSAEPLSDDALEVDPPAPSPISAATGASGSGRADQRGFQKRVVRPVRRGLLRLAADQSAPASARTWSGSALGQARHAPQAADQRYDNAHLFGAICPARGVGAALALPHADADMMQLDASKNLAIGSGF